MNNAKFLRIFKPWKTSASRCPLRSNLQHFRSIAMWCGKMLNFIPLLKFPEVLYSEASQTSKMEFFGEILNDFQPLTIFTKIFVLDVWKSPEYISGIETRWLTFIWFCDLHQCMSLVFFLKTLEIYWGCIYSATNLMGRRVHCSDTPVYRSSILCCSSAFVRNQSVDLPLKSNDWFLYDGNIGRLHISCRWSFSIPPENIKKPLVS